MGKFTKKVVIKRYNVKNVGRCTVTVSDLEGKSYILKEGMECVVNKKPFSTKLIIEEIIEKPIEKKEKIIVKKEKTVKKYGESR